jgi:hypothetical protein
VWWTAIANSSPLVAAMYPSKPPDLLIFLENRRIVPKWRSVPPSPPALLDSAEVLQNQAFLEPPENDRVAPRCSTVGRPGNPYKHAGKGVLGDAHLDEDGFSSQDPANGRGSPAGLTPGFGVLSGLSRKLSHGHRLDLLEGAPFNRALMRWVNRAAPSSSLNTNGTPARRYSDRPFLTRHHGLRAAPMTTQPSESRSAALSLR